MSFLAFVLLKCEEKGLLWKCYGYESFMASHWNKFQGASATSKTRAVLCAELSADLMLLQVVIMSVSCQDRKKMTSQQV